MLKVEETMPVFPDQPVSRSSHRILSLQIMRLCGQYRIVVAYIMLFSKANKKGGLHLHHLHEIINPR
jgi:hypothetical protein